MAAYLYLVGALFLPAVHYFYDAVAIRDAGTVWGSLTWRIADERHFFPAAILNHIEGPLQFVLLNLYEHVVGNVLPLDPATMQLPNTALALAAGAVAWRLGARLYGARLGAFAALALLFMPWLGVTIRAPWFFNMLSVLLHLLTWLFAVRLALDHGDRGARIGLPVALALYGLTGLDWPTFLPPLALFLVLAGALRPALRNGWNVLPLLVLLAHAGWTLALYVYGRRYNPARAHMYWQTLLVHPFGKVSAAQGASFGKMTGYVVETFGPVLVLALAGIVPALSAGAAVDTPPRARVRRAFVLAMIAWALVTCVAVVRFSISLTYGYVAAVPLAFLGAFLLARLPARAAVALVALMALTQATVVARAVQAGPDRHDRRVLAAAAFLLERRPDLLAAGKTAFLPRNDPSNIGQYARGPYQRLIMPLSFPVERVKRSVTSPVPGLLDFVTGYEADTIRADWLILCSESLTAGPNNKAADFYRRLAADPRVSWIAAFEAAQGRLLWLGEVKPGGPAIASAPRQDVAALADLYTARYDRINFLKRHAAHILHY